MLTEIERLRAALQHARQVLIRLRTPLEADKEARGAAIEQINLALGEWPAGPFAGRASPSGTEFVCAGERCWMPATEPRVPVSPELYLQDGLPIIEKGTAEGSLT
jgi:hypothetical protein